mgnify:CR=1
MPMAGCHKSRGKYIVTEDDGFVGWMIHFYSTNVSDVPFTPTYAQAKWYEGDKLNGSSPAVDYNYMRNWMESETLVKGEMRWICTAVRTS